MEIHHSKFEDVLSLSLCHSLGLLSVPEINNWDRILCENIKSYIETAQQNEESSKARSMKILSVAVSALQTFVQMNWLGPPSSDFKTFFLPDDFQSGEKKTEWNSYVMNSMSFDGETVYSKVEHLELLMLSKVILLQCRSLLSEHQMADLWLLRCLKIHQDLFEQKSPTLKDKIVEVIQDLTKKEPLMTDDAFRDVQIQIHLEAGYLLYFYYMYKEAVHHLNTAAKLAGLEVKLTGAMGKRTKYQEKATAQLLLTVRRTADSSSQSNVAVAKSESSDSDLPKIHLMDDDTLLDEVNLSEELEHTKTSVSALEQAVILGLLYHHRKSQANVEDILSEESMAYISFILSQPQNWCVQTNALLSRTAWDKETSRRLQRNLGQLEELVNLYKKVEPAVEKRLRLFFCSNVPPKWEVERRLGVFFMKIGAFSSALESFLRIDQWDDIIKCYGALGRTEKAENVIRERLAVEETPDLLCYLGEVTNNPEEYKKAWELSKGRSSKAQRNLGFYHLRRNEFEQSIDPFEKSLAINSLQLGVWFSYGCACMGCSQFEKASNAFRRCVTLDPRFSEAWNNLATSYVNTNHKAKAFAALQESVKCNYENWRIWENLLLVGSDIGQFAQAIRAYHRLLDLRDKHVDTDVLQILVRAVNEDIPDVKEIPASSYRKQLQELFGRLTSKVTTDAKVWRLYADLLNGNPEKSQDMKERAVQYLQKSHRCSTQTPNWEKDVTKAKKVSSESVDLAEAYLTCVKSVVEPAKVQQLLTSAKFMIKGVLSKVKQSHTDPMSKELNSELTDVCAKLEEKLNDIGTCIEQIKS